MYKQHYLWQSRVLWQYCWLLPLPLLSGLSGPTGWARVCGWVFRFFFPPTCILSPQRKEIKVINSRRDCKQGNLVRISARFGFVTQFAVCKNSLWLPKWLGTLRNIKVWLWIRTYIRKNICLNSLVPLAQEIESGVWYSSLSSERTSLGSACKERCWQEFQFPGMTLVKQCFGLCNYISSLRSEIDRAGRNLEFH